MVVHTKEKGALLVLVIIYGTIFFLIIVSFMGFVITQSQIQEHKLQQEKALAIAEAGLNYYKWYLAHNPDDVTHGTGAPGPYVMPYGDAEEGIIGEYSLAIASSTFCGEVTHIDVESTGYTNDAPTLTRTISARYARPTIAEFSFITSKGVWFGGGGEPLVGPIHANGGIRMDGAHNSIVTSGQEEWECNTSFGCSPAQTVDGVFGEGPDSHLWLFPSPPIDFTGITLDLSTMKTKAETGGGIFLGSSGAEGYHVVINDDDTIDVRVVQNTVSYTAYESVIGWTTDDDIIYDSTFQGTYTLNPDCPLVFIEDRVWLEGDVASKISIAAANATDPSIIIEGNIMYASSSAGLLAVAENNIEVGIDILENTTVQGIYVAQNGSFRRNYVSYSALPTGYKDKYTIDSMDFLGTMVSKERAVTTWVNSSGDIISGIIGGTSSYDRDLISNPPPLTPHTSDDYRFVEWQEEAD